MHYALNASQPPGFKPWHCACGGIILLQSKKITLPPPRLHALLQVYPASFGQLWTMVEPCVFILSRSSDTHSNFDGKSRVLCGLLTLQCTCHLFKRWSGLLLQVFRGSETSLSLITVIYCDYCLLSKGRVGWGIVRDIKKPHKLNQNLKNWANSSQECFKIMISSLSEFCGGWQYRLLWHCPVIACIPL